MANQWLRLWHDMPTDPKWRTISRVSGQRIGDVMAVYIHILVCASNASERGRTQSFNSEDVASALDLEAEQVEQIVAAMQGRVLDDDMVRGWAKRQVAREDGGAERAKAWREAKKAESKRTPNASERTPNASERNRTPDKDKDKDTDTDKENTPKAPKGAECDRFEAFWATYPRRVGKDAARRAFAKRKVDDDLLAQMLAAVSTQSASDGWTRDGGKFIPHPSTWLNEGRWQDEQTTTEANPQPADWWTAAGFQNRWEAENELCFAHNANEFRDGHRVEAVQ